MEIVDDRTKISRSAWESEKKFQLVNSLFIRAHDGAPNTISVAVHKTGIDEMDEAAKCSCFYVGIFTLKYEFMEMLIA
ncbi:MAG: hypothetical protein L0Z73_04490 [Gammaproteobacteria bacterium]|nr:hypothetical protein [Gammaproteobacteria bacterium]